MTKLIESIKKEYTPNSFIVKISHVCNLACRDCYYYNSPKVTEKRYPDFIGLDTAQNLWVRLFSINIFKQR